MTRTYARQETRWDLDLLKMLVQAGDAKEFPNGIYVVKTDDGSFAVRPHQIISREEKLAITLDIPSTEEHNRMLAAEALVEELFTARHGIAEVRDGEFREDEQVMVDALLNSDEAELEHSIREEITELQYREQEKRTGIYIPVPDSAEEDALLAKFGV